MSNLDRIAAAADDISDDNEKSKNLTQVEEILNYIPQMKYFVQQLFDLEEALLSP